MTEAQLVQPMPLPISIVIDWVTGWDTENKTHVKFVRMQIFSPTGSSVYFLEPKNGIIISEILEKQSKEALSGIVTAPPGLDISKVTPFPTNGKRRR